MRSSRSVTPTRSELEHTSRLKQEQCERQADVRGRRRRGAARRHDHRHRGLGLAPQADEHRAGHRPLDAAGPHGRELRRPRPRPAVRDRQGEEGGVPASARSTRSRSSRTSATPASRAAVQTLELDEGMFLLGLQAAAWRVPFLPTRVGLGSIVVDRQPEIKTVVSPYDDGEELVAAPGAAPRRRPDPHAPRRRRAATGSTSTSIRTWTTWSPWPRRPMLHERRAARSTPRSWRATARCSPC